MIGNINVVVKVGQHRKPAGGGNIGVARDKDRSDKFVI